jgi:hypothetical protein
LNNSYKGQNEMVNNFEADLKVMFNVISQGSFTSRMRE